MTWRSKKHLVVSRRSAEAELRALSLGVCEGLWINKVMKDLKITVQVPIHVYCDNISAIHVIENPVQHDKSKHIEIDKHFLREKIEEKDIKLKLHFIRSKEQIADILTKPVSVQVFKTLLDKLGCINIYTSSLRGSVGILVSHADKQTYNQGWTWRAKPQTKRAKLLPVLLWH